MSHRTEAPSRVELRLQMPAAVLRYWTDAAGAGSGLADAELYRLSKSTRGVHLLSPGTLVATPESGDPAIFDTAIRVAEQMLEALRDSEPRLRLMVLPAQVRLRDGSPELRSDVLVERAPEWLGSLEPGRVHLTGWVRHMLERSRIHRQVTSASGPAGHQIPIHRAGRNQPENAPWRNAEILNRRIPSIPRPEIEAPGRELLSEPAWRISGPLGCGKTHFAHHLLAAAKTPRLWLRGEPSHRRQGSLAQRIARQIESSALSDEDSIPWLSLEDPALMTRFRELAESPSGEDSVRESARRLAEILSGLAAATDRTFYLVIDDLELSESRDLDLVAQLLSTREVGRTFRLLLAGRGGVPLPGALEELPELFVGPFTEGEMSEFSPQLFAGLSLPTSTQNRLQSATQGCPLALEEGMIALIREKDLRRVYGSFFFAGQETAGFSPSPRLLCHLQAEAFRLGLETPLHLLSLLETGAPAPLVRGSSKQVGREIPEGWEASARSSGILRDVAGPWGSGVGFLCPAYGLTLADGIEPDSVQDLRVAIGSTLAGVSDSGKALWESYRLLRGTPEAIDTLMKTLESSYASRIPNAAKMEVLTQELYRHRERQGDPETELQLLWKLLPLARKLGRLNEFASQLDRGVELSKGDPRRLLALAALKAERDQDAGRYDEAESTIRLALQAAKGADDRRQALLLIQLGRLHLDQERYPEAKDLFRKLVEHLDRSGLEALSASCHYYLGNIAFHEGNFEESLELHRGALERRRRQNLSRVAGNSLTAMGAVYLALGNYPQALHCYREAQELLEQHGSEADRAFPLLGLGRALNHLGDYASSSRILRQALTLREGRDDLAGEAVARLAVAENHLFLGQLDRAQEEATKAHFQLNLLSRKTLLADAEQLLGRIQERLRKYDSAQKHLRRALEHHRQRGDQRATAFDLAYLLHLALTIENDQDTTRYTAALDEAVAKLARPELAEKLHYWIYRGRQRLKNRQLSEKNPLPSLERAYRELLRKASHLNPELRHHFLFQIAEYRDIVESATRAGLSSDLVD